MRLNGILAIVPLLMTSAAGLPSRSQAAQPRLGFVVTVITAVTLVIVLVELVTAMRKKSAPDAKALCLALTTACAAGVTVAAGWVRFEDAGSGQLVAAGAAGLLTGLATWGQLRLDLFSRYRSRRTEVASDDPRSGLAEPPSTRGDTSSSSASRRALDDSGSRIVEGPVAEVGDVTLKGKYVAGHDMRIGDAERARGERKP